MKTNSTAAIFQEPVFNRRCLVSWAGLMLAMLAAALVSGCQTYSDFSSSQGPVTSATSATNAAPDLINLREGDTLKISFPGSPTLDTTQQIRRDGKITLPLVGEVDAAGMPPAALEKKLVELYGPQLVTKQVTVELLNSSFPVYLTGMVLRPGKIMSDHPITALEAIMEAGGFDYTKANTRGVIVIRREGNVMKNYTLNLKNVLDGKQNEPFYLKPGDIVYVPERFTLF